MLIPVWMRQERRRLRRRVRARDDGRGNLQGPSHSGTEYRMYDQQSTRLSSYHANQTWRVTPFHAKLASRASHFFSKPSQPLRIESVDPGRVLSVT